MSGCEGQARPAESGAQGMAVRCALGLISKVGYRIGGEGVRGRLGRRAGGLRCGSAVRRSSSRGMEGGEGVKRVGRIGVDEVAKWVGSGGSDFVVVDVRDGDFGEGGFVKGAVNVPSDTFRERMGAVLEEHGDKETIVVHCMMSQMRGPTCATMLVQAMNAAEGKSFRANVVVMTGGFRQFCYSYSGRADLIADSGGGW